MATFKLAALIPIFATIVNALADDIDHDAAADYDLGFRSRRLLQFSNIMTQPPVNQFGPNLQTYGYYGQTCEPPQADFQCTMVGQQLTDKGAGKIECGTSYSCCLCGSVLCGYNGTPCDGIMANAPSTLHGVQQIYVQGQPDTPGAVIDCAADNACSGSIITGTWLSTIKCGVDACIHTSVQAEYAMGLTCGVRACMGGSFVLTKNRGGLFECMGETACSGAYIEVHGGVSTVMCGGDSGCQGAYMVIRDPDPGFTLICGGESSCENMRIDVIVSSPTTGCTAQTTAGYTVWEGITCSANRACAGLQFNVENNGCNSILLETLECLPGESCTGAAFNFNYHPSSVRLPGTLSSNNEVLLQNCKCGPSCQQASGIDKCYNNLHLVQCLNDGICANQVHALYNVANGFLLVCGGVNSCSSLDLTIDIGGNSNNVIALITGFDCTAYGACRNMLVRMQNTQTTSMGLPVRLIIETLLCTAESSCEGAVFVTGDYVSFEHVLCQGVNACNNCVVKKYINSVGVPCSTAGTVQIPLIPSTTTTTTTATTTTSPQNPAPVNTIPSIPSIPVIPSVPSVSQTTTTSSTTTTTTTTAAPLPPGVLNLPVPPQTTAALQSTTIPGIPSIPVIPPVLNLPVPPQTTAAPVAPQTTQASAPPIIPPVIPPVIPDPVIPVVPAQSTTTSTSTSTSTSTTTTSTTAAPRSTRNQHGEIEPQGTPGASNGNVPPIPGIPGVPSVPSIPSLPSIPEPQQSGTPQSPHLTKSPTTASGGASQVVPPVETPGNTGNQPIGSQIKPPFSRA